MDFENKIIFQKTLDHHTTNNFFENMSANKKFASFNPAAQAQSDNNDLVGDDVAQTSFNLQSMSGGQKIAASITGRVIGKFEQRERSATSTSANKPPVVGKMMLMLPPTECVEIMKDQFGD